MIVCDIWAKKYGHYEFNNSILNLLVKNSEIKIKYFGDREQIKIFNIKNDIDFYNLNIDETTKLKKIKGYILNILQIRKHQEDIVIILSGDPLIVLLSKILLAKKEIYIILHGLDTIKNTKNRMSKYFKLILKILNKNINFIVLGESIRHNLIKLIPEIEKNVFSIDHPYSFEKNSLKKKLAPQIRLSTCGITSEQKGLYNIYEFIDKSNFKFKHIGKSETIILKEYSKYFPYKDELISKEVYEKLLSELDYIIILYPRDSYQLTASGVYFDCIKFNKPLLGLKNEYFEYMFEKYGEIGKLFNTIDEIINYLKKDRKILEQEQNIFWKNMEKIRKTLNKNVEKDLLKIIYLGENNE